MHSLNELIAELRERVRQQRPLIHHITNFVVMNDTANVTLHIGGLPVMAHAREEVAEMVAAAGALVLNPGTLTPEWVEAMLIAGKRANELGIPIVLDPVGAGATTLRTESNRRLLEELKIAVVRGNSGEIGALTGMGGVVKGVEAVVEVDDPVTVAKALARRYGTTVAITGPRDIVTDGTRVFGVDNGHPMLKTITGTGCAATTMIAAFAAVERDYALAAVAGLACFGLAAELAAAVAHGPGSFKVALYDAIYNLSADQIRAGAKVVEISGDSHLEGDCHLDCHLDWSLYVITDARLARGRSHLEVIRAAIAGGATVVQYREKGGTTRQMIEEARALRELARQAGVPFIVNDRVDIALAVDADGVHVGQDDMPAPLARKLMGPGKIIGVSVDNVEQALQAERDGADYIGAGPIFATPTKPDAAPPIGLDGLAEICRRVSIPVVAIGGINEENAASVIAAGADGVAVVSAVVAAEDVEEAARRLRQAVEKARLRPERPS